MLDNSVFEDWLDTKSKELVIKIGNGESLSSEEMIILVLKAQSNHFVHLDIDMKDDMKILRVDMDKRFQQVNKRFDESRKDMDRRFEQVDKRFEQMLGRMDRFMFWSLGLTVSSTLFILGFLKFGI